MAGRAGLFNLDKEGVLVAVVEYVLHPLNMAGRLPLLPELLAGAAPEPGETGLDGPLERFPVHVCDHKNLVVLPVLDHCGDEAFVIEF